VTHPGSILAIEPRKRSDAYGNDDNGLNDDHDTMVTMNMLDVGTTIVIVIAIVTQLAGWLGPILFYFAEHPDTSEQQNHIENTTLQPSPSRIRFANI
jgi:hypothetical protein